MTYVQNTLYFGVAPPDHIITYSSKFNCDNTFPMTHLFKQNIVKLIVLIISLVQIFLNLRITLYKNESERHGNSN